MSGQLSRRRLLHGAGGVVALGSLGMLESGCSSGKSTEQKVVYRTGTESGQFEPVLRSMVPRPAPYRRPLPLPQPLAPKRSTDGEDFYELTAKPGHAQILDGHRTSIWGYDGVFPGPLFESRRGRQVRVRLINRLPVPIVRHLHGAFTPAPSDGYPLDYVLPIGGWQHVHAGGRTHEIAWDYVHPMDQRAGLLWYHDHRMDFSGPQVWRGLVGLHVHRDEEEAALGLPSGDHELPLLICDRSFGPGGDFIYPSLDPDLGHRPGVRAAFTNGVLGDTVLVNGVHAPYHEVRQGTYRLRIAIAGNARRYRLAFDHPPSAGEPFVLIGTDGGLMESPMTVRSFVIGPAERVDVIVDFSGYAAGTTVRMQNLSGGEGTTEIVEFRVAGPDNRPRWRAPQRLCRIDRLDPAAAVRTRSFAFSRVPTAKGPEFRIGHDTFSADRVAADPRQGDIEIWQFTSDIGHPVHLHNAQFQVLGDSGPLAWKDVVAVGAGETRRIITRFDSYKGQFIMHCHNLEHEDMGMMANYVIR